MEIYWDYIDGDIREFTIKNGFANGIFLVALNNNWDSR